LAIGSSGDITSLAPGLSRVTLLSPLLGILMFHPLVGLLPSLFLFVGFCSA